MKYFLPLMVLLTICRVASSAELFGTVDAISGTAMVNDQSGKSSPVVVGMNIYEGQTITSGSEGEVHLVTEDGGIVALRPDTIFRVDEYKADGDSTDKIFMSLLKGTVRSITGWIGKLDHSAYRITTPTATIGVRGTDHETSVIDKGNGDEPGTYDTVNEGSTVMNTQHGTIEVIPGRFAFAPKGRSIAPFFLAQRPHFLAFRRLRIEERIQTRKEVLRSRLFQMREERIHRLRSINSNRIKTTTHLRDQNELMNEHNRIENHKLSQTAPEKPTLRKRIEQRRANNTRLLQRRSLKQRNVMLGKPDEKKKRHYDLRHDKHE